MPLPPLHQRTKSFCDWLNEKGDKATIRRYLSQTSAARKWTEYERETLEILPVEGPVWIPQVEPKRVLPSPGWVAHTEKITHGDRSEVSEKFKIELTIKGETYFRKRKSKDNIMKRFTWEMRNLKKTLVKDDATRGRFMSPTSFEVHLAPTTLGSFVELLRNTNGCVFPHVTKIYSIK